MKQRLAPRMPLASLKTYDAGEENADAPAEPVVAPTPQIESKAALAADVQASAGVHDIAIDLIDKSPHQPRLIFDPEAIDTLASSIEESGLISPITVRPLENGRYELIGGERRLRAHQSLGRKLIPGFVISDISATDAAIGALADNDAKRSLCDYERGKAYKRALAMQTETGKPITQGMLARRIGVSDATVSRCLAFFDLPNEALELLDAKPDLIGAKNAAILATLAKKGHPRIVLQALKKISQDGASEQGAVNWATSEVNKLGKLTRESVSLKLEGRHIADVVTDGSRIIISCKNGFNPDDLVAKLSEMLG
jgi:ParB family transcriptional regulator, chromosome partitioning protein